MNVRPVVMGAGLALSVVLVGCGGGGDDGGGGEASGAVAPASGGDAAGAEKPAAAVESTGASSTDVLAKDIAFEPKELSAPAGPIKLTLKNEGVIIHTLVFDAVPNFSKLEVATKGATDAGTLDVKPGTYTFYCDQPGHRSAGMEGKLTVG